jgi:hypothetical protein
MSQLDTEFPLANEGDAISHIATFERPAEVSALLDDFHDELELLS